MEEKDCFGILDRVFPVGREGFREVVPECFNCPEKTMCLRRALSTKEGIEMRAEILDRYPAGGLLGRLRRWSEKKTMSRQLENQKETK